MSTRILMRIEKTQVTDKKELRELIGGNTVDIDKLVARVALLEQNGDPDDAEPAPALRKARIPSRPSIMVESGAGKDPKHGGE